MGKYKDLGRLAALVVSLVLVVALVGNLSRRKKEGQVTPPAQTGAPVETAQPGAMQSSDTNPTAAPAGGAGSADSDTRATVVYYQDNYGYLVPVMSYVPAQDGIAKATLSKMVQNPANDMDAARLGLRTVLPEGVGIDLDITNEGVARIDLTAQANNMPDAASESNMVNAVVQTLTEFPTVKKVSFLVGGQKLAKLKHGTDISGEFTRGDLNLEGMDGSLPTGANTVKLYFPGEDGALIVPVTRAVFSPADIDTAVLELAKGPAGDTPLDTVLPPGCGVIGVDVKDGVASINFTREFIGVAENSDGGRQALRALVLTCTQFPGVKSVKVQVEGEDYDPGQSTLAVPTFVNEADSVMQQYIQTQSAMIFEE